MASVATGSADRPSRASLALAGMGVRGRETFGGFGGGSGGGSFQDHGVQNVGYGAVPKSKSTKSRVIGTPAEEEERAANKASQKEKERKKKDLELVSEIKAFQGNVRTAFLSLNKGKSGTFDANVESMRWIISLFGSNWPNKPPSNARGTIQKITEAKIGEKYRELVEA